MLSSLATRLAVIAALATPAAAVAGAEPAVAVDARLLALPQARDAARDNEVLVLSLTGRQRSDDERVPLNLCIAIDQSGSMLGDKLAAAGRAALAATRRLHDDDTVSIVAYDSVVQVLVPATRAKNRAAVEAGLARLAPGGATSLFAGLVKCVEELRRSQNPWAINRVVLISDGRANVGPSSPAELGRYGAYLMSEGISVSTIGLGLDYNEDVMAELAWRSDGHHSFAPADLERALSEEMDRLQSIVARDVDVDVDLGAGLRPVRVLGRRAEVAGGAVRVRFAKVHGGREHVLAIEVQPSSGGPSGKPRQRVTSATVRVSWIDLVDRRTETRRLNIAARADGGRALPADAHTIAQLTVLLADDTTEIAIRLRDEGRVDEAMRQLKSSAARLQAAARLGSGPVRSMPLGKLAERQEETARNVAAPKEQWNVHRKLMKQQVGAATNDGLDMR